MRRDRYHHGDLRRALITAALGLVSEKGAKGCTLTEVARRAGVSPAAPYRHFADKEDLLAAVATVAFERFHAALTEPELPSDPVAELAETGRRYVAWAIAHPDDFRVMFGLDLDRRRHPELVAAADRAFGVLRDAVAQLRITADAPLDDELDLAGALWSIGHGMATLAISGDLRRAGVGADPAELASAAGAAVVAEVTRRRRR